MLLLLLTIRLLLLSSFVLSSSSDGSQSQPDAASAINIASIGEPIIVWSSVDTYHQCNIIDVPDIPARVFLDPTRNVTHMIEGSTAFRHMNGPSVWNLTRSCKTSWNMTGAPLPSLFAGNEFLDSPIVFDNGTVVALIHTEFPGNRYQYQCDTPGKTNYPYCWTVSIGLAISTDFGSTWNHMRKPPLHLVATVPYPYNSTQLAFGWGDPSNIVKSPLDGYYYFAMWNRNQIGDQAPGTCIARTKNLMDPGSWRGWNGTMFAVVLNTSPYTANTTTTTTTANENDENAQQHICKVVNLPTNCASLGLVWSVYLETFVTTLGCFGKMSRAFYFAMSDNLIDWSNYQEFYSRDDLTPSVSKMTTAIAYPTFVDQTAPYAWNDPNFYTIGQTPHLFWVSLGHSPYSDGRNLWATPMKFSKTTANTTSSATNVVIDEE